MSAIPEPVQCNAILDAFTVDGSWLAQSPYLAAFATNRLQALRRAAGFRPRFGVAPLSSETPIAINDTAFHQLRVAVGSVLWGLALYVDNGAGYAIQISETNGRSLFSEPVQIALGSTGSGLVTASPGVFYLVEPFTVAASGELNVQISNLGAQETGTPYPMQLILLLAEPNGADTTDAAD
jgi:hypothetical protein